MNKIRFISQLVCLLVLFFSSNVWAAFTCGVNPSTTVEVGETYTFWFDAGMDLPPEIDMRAYLDGSSTSYITLIGGQQYWDMSVTPISSKTVDFAFKAYDTSSSNVGDTLCETSVAITPAPAVSNVSPLTAIQYVTTTFTVTGTNLPSTIALQLDNAECGSEYSVTTTSAKVDCSPQGTGQQLFYVAKVTLGAAIDGSPFTVWVDEPTPDPTVQSVSPSPSSVESGSSITFNATLSGNLPSGYAMLVDFGAGYQSMSGSGSSFYKTSIVNTGGTNRPFTVRMNNSSGSLISSRTGYYTVTALPDPYPPTISIISAATTAIAGGDYSVTLEMSDIDEDLKNLQINWGDGSTNSVVDLVGSNSTKSVSHVYSSAGNYTWNATVQDHLNYTASVQRTVAVEAANQSPTISVTINPAVSGNTLTTTVTSTDDSDVTWTSFAIFNTSNIVLDTSNLTINSPTSTYNNAVGVYTWGYNPSSTPTSTNWNVDISSLADGDYKIMFYATDGTISVDSGFYSFTKTNFVLPTLILLPVTESGDPNANLTFAAQLSDALPAGYGVFINFDDQQGSWFIQNTPGGHMELDYQSGTTYSVNYSLEKPGLRSFRAGIFNLQGDSDPSNDVLMNSYTDSEVCTLDICLATISRPNSFGNPSLTHSGSQLFKNVDVANGNYHLSTTDISVPGEGPSFAFSRAYNSQHDKPCTFAYEMKAEFLVGTYDREIAIGPREDGHIQYFFKDMDGLWYALNSGNFDQLMEDPDGSFVLYTQGNRLYRFADPAGIELGRLQTIEDRLGNGLMFNYTGNDLTGITDANNRDYTILRDGNNRIQRVTDFSGRYVEYTYDINGMITDVRNVRGDYEHYTYAYFGLMGDDLYYLNTITDPRNNVQSIVRYSTLGNVTEIEDGDGNVTMITYSTVNEKPYTGISQPPVDGVNSNKAYFLDANRKRVEEVVDAESYGDYKTTQTFQSVTTRAFLAEQSLQTRIVEPNINSTTDIAYSADGRGNATQITDAKGRLTNATYTTIGGQQNLTPVATVQKPGVATATQFQSFTATGKATVITDPRSYSTNRTFNSSDWLTQTTNARSYSTNYNYDAYGNVTLVTDAKNSQTSRTYDSLGRLATETTPLGLMTNYTYDALGNILSKNVLAAGINYTSQYTYDASNNLTQAIDPLDHVTNYAYDSMNRKTTETYAVASVPYSRSYDYDALGRLKTVTNERGQTSETFFTPRSKVDYQINPLLQTVTYTYDANGNVATVTDAEGRVITTIYDELNRKTRVTDSLGNYQEWSYNTAGQIATHRDSRGKISSYTYDAMGNLTRLTDPNGGITESTYDGNGNVLTVKDPNLHTTTYAYDELDRRISTTLNNGQQWTYAYDANGNVLSETTPTGERTEKIYDALNRVTQLTEKAANTTIVRQISYTYDANSNVLSESDGTTISYIYDEINRITSVTDQYGQTIGYGYDKAGNRTTLIYPGNKAITYNYDNADRLQSLTDWLSDTTSYIRNDTGQATEVVYGNGTKAQYSFDPVGRLTLLENRKADDTIISSHNLSLDEGGNISEATIALPLEPSIPESLGAMSYDNNNRLLAAGTTNYTHDPSGRIIEDVADGTQTIYNFDIKDHLTSISRAGTTLSSYGYDLNNNRVSQVQAGVETRYVIDQLAPLANVVAETDDQGTISQYYLYGEGLVAQIDAGGDSHYYHYDPTGHTLALSDASGNVTDKYAYTPYGSTTSQGSSKNPFRFVGQHGVMDDGDGLHYMRARYYREDIKRFMSLDALHGEITSPQTLNRYAYVLGNPLRYIDSSGMDAGEIWRMEPINLETDNHFASMTIESEGYFSLKKSGIKNKISKQVTTNAKLGGFENTSTISVNSMLTGYYEIIDEIGNQSAKVEVGAGSCINASNDVKSYAIAGLKISVSGGLAAGVCAGGSATAYNNDIYAGLHYSGVFSPLKGVNGDLNIGVEKNFWYEVGAEVHRNTNDIRKYHKYMK